jgi:hypothetical protein
MTRRFSEDAMTVTRQSHSNSRSALIAAAGLATILALSSAHTACRSGKRAVRASGEAATLKGILNGLEPEDKGHADWIYEMSGCVPAVNGTLVTDGGGDVVTFKSTGLKTGVTGCQLRVRTIGPVAPNAKPIVATEPDVVYWSKNFEISQSPDGELTSQINVIRLYEVVGPPESGFTLKVPVKFPAAEPESVSAKINCTPAVSNPGAYTTTSALEGEFTFAMTLAGGADFNCTDLDVHAGAVRGKYKGTFKGTDGQIKGAATQTISTKRLALKLVVEPSPSPNPSVAPSPGQIDVGVGGVKECKDTEVYNTTTRKCEPKKP